MTGPMLKPANTAQMYNEVLKLLERPSDHISLTIPPVIFASVAAPPPVMILVMIKVAKFCATAWGIRKMMVMAYMTFN